jgi:hypothetical protein
MVRRSTLCLAGLVLLLLAGNGANSRPQLTASTTSPQSSSQLVGRWRVKFKFNGGVEKNLILDAKAKGSGSFQMLDTEPGDKPLAHVLPAAWSQLTNDRVSFSSEVELPIGNCCREIGTLLFKGRFASPNSVTGKLIFVTSVDEEENPYQFRTVIGTFTAARLVGE